MHQIKKNDWGLVNFPVSSRVRTKKKRKKGKRSKKMLTCGVKSHLGREFSIKQFLKEGCINVDFKQILWCGWKEKKKRKGKKIR